MLLPLTFANAAAEDVRVVFASQAQLQVREAKREGDLYRLVIGEGNTLTVPADAVAEIRVLDAEPARIGGTEASGGVGDGLAEAHTEIPDLPWPELARPYRALFAEAATRHGVELELLLAVARVESHFDPFAVSPKGALGMMQLMPGTARQLRVDDVFDARQNLDGGARWLRRLLDRYDGDLRLTLAAYNAGEGAVHRHDGIPPYPETVTYVRRVLDAYLEVLGEDAAERRAGLS
jgi:hypothetical protein